MEDKKNLGNLMDCVKKAFNVGSERGYEFKKMRHAIIADLKRLGYHSSEIKDKLLEWNERCEKVLPPNEQRRQLFDYVDWTDKQNDCKVGCRALEDFCIGQDKCLFYKQKMHLGRKAVETSPFDFNEARHYLEERFKADGYALGLILNAIRRYQIQQGTGEIIYIGVRKISTLIRDHDKHTIDPMTVFRRVQDLISEGMLEIVSKGEAGTFNRKANCYTFLPWRLPSNHPK